MKTVYLLGAGFTRAICGQVAPLTHEIISKLDLDKLSNLPEINQQSDIELLISSIDLKCLQLEKANPHLAKKYNRAKKDITAQVVKLFDIDSLAIKTIKNFIDRPLPKKFIDSIPYEGTILTLNYDCVLDQGLHFSKRWSPFGGYGFLSPAGHNDENEKKEKIILLKLHGSCNFRNSSEDAKYPNIEISPKIFPGLPSNLHLRTSSLDKGPHVLVMSYIKKFHNGILLLWKKAIEALLTAEKLIIVGCSLRDEDAFLKFALYHFGTEESIAKFYIDIVDENEESCENIKNKILSLVGKPENKQNIRTFCDSKKYLNNMARG